MSHLPFYLFVMSLALSPAYAQLPSWAANKLSQVDKSKAPDDADVWRLIDETELEVRRNGKIEIRRRILQIVLKEEGAENASYYVINGNEETTKVRELQGWHRDANGEMDELSKKNLYTIGRSSLANLNRDTVSLALFENVDKDSVVAFESEELVENLFSIELWNVLGEFPTQEKIIRLNTASQGERFGVRLEPVLFDAWNLNYEQNGNSLKIANLPAYMNESMSPSNADAYPFVILGFPKSDGSDPLTSWDHLARWYYDYFNRAAVAGKAGSSPAPDVTSLEEISAWIDQTISYRQRYLSAARGWEPAPGNVVARRAYGDCKDMVACMAYRAKEKNIQVLPVLASIADGFEISPDKPVANYFNHLIAAIPLATSMNLPAEVMVDGKPYLLADPTGRYTPFGYLHGGHAGKNVMICTANGARWVKVPKGACEAEKVLVKVTGALDENFTLKGTIELFESGDSFGFRSTHQFGNPLDVEWAIRDWFEIPGAADFIAEKTEVDDQNRLHVIYKVKWPSFMRRDAGGVRLTTAVTGDARGALLRSGETRQSPLALRASPEVTWDLAIQSKTPLTPNQTETAWSGDHHNFSWTASGGQNVRVTFTRTRQPLFYGKDQIEEGVAYWKDYRANYNRFWASAPLFQLPE